MESICTDARRTLIMEWKEFKTTDFFDIKKGKRLTKADQIPGNIPFIGSSSTNNGITAYIGNNDNLHPANTITVSYNGSVGQVFYQECPFWASDDVNVWYPKITMSTRIILYFMAAIKKKSVEYSYTHKWTLDRMKSETFILPVTTTGTPDWEYMELYIKKLENERILELEEERIRELSCYLLISGLDDYKLNSAEQNAIQRFRSNTVKYKVYKLGKGDNRLFDISSPKKRFNANEITFGGKYPYVVRSGLNNGIRGYITQDECYLNPAKTISFGQDTATMFYQEQPYFTGDKIKIMFYRDRELDPELASYLLTAMKKAFQNFKWGQSSFNENILKNMEISLPVDANDNIDYPYITTFMNAQKKLSIKSIMDRKDQMINLSKKCI